MKLRASILLGLGALVFSASAAMSQSLKSLRQHEADEAELNREAAYTSSVCGSALSAKIDWNSAASWPADTSLAAACDGALGAIETICRSDNGKSRGAKVKIFICAGDGSGPSLSGGTFSYGATPGGDGYSDSLPYLEQAL